MAKIYQGTKKVKITVPTGIDLTSASVTKLYIKKPNGSEAIWTTGVTIVAPATDGNLQYYTLAGDLDLPGLYLGMAYVETTGGAGKYWGETFSFKIWEKYK